MISIIERRAKIIDMRQKPSVYEDQENFTSSVRNKNLGTLSEEVPKKIDLIFASANMCGNPVDL